MKKFLTIFTIFILLSSCDNDSPSESIPIENVEISLEGLPQLLEELTELSVSVQSPSGNLTTTAYIDDLEVANSRDQSFSFNIDPFDYTSGEKMLTVVARDGDGAEKESSFSFELKKLLIKVTEPFGNSTYMTLNKLNGELIDFKKIENADNNSFYAADGFERQNFMITSYFLNSFDNRTYIQSYSDISPGTVTLTREEREAELNSNLSFANIDTTVLSLSSEGDHLISGYNGVVQAENRNLVFGPLPDGAHNFLYSVDDPEDFFLFSTYHNSATFRNKYVRINDISKTEYVEADFLPIPDYEKISIVPNNLGDFNYSVDGFKTTEDYEINKFYRINSDVASPINNYEIRIPKLDDIFSTFLVKLTVSTLPIADAHVEIHKRYDGQDITVPLVHMTKNDNTLIFEGAGEYDYASLTYSTNGANPGNFSSFTWHFHQAYDVQVNIPFPTIETPAEILEAMNTSTLQDINNDKYLSCTLNDYEEDVILKNLIFSSGYASLEKGNWYQFRFNDLLR